MAASATDFVQFRAQLEQDEQTEWLKDIGDNADTLIAGTLANTQDAKSPYDGRLVEQLLKETADALDRCLAFRREADDLEVLAIKAALDDKLFNDSQAIEQEIDRLTHPVDESQTEGAAYLGAANQFQEGKNDFLLSGLTTASKGLADRANASASNATAFISELNEKRMLVQAYQRRLQRLHVTKGSGLFFADRRARVLTLLADDMRTVALKVSALQRGINDVFGTSLTLTNSATLEDYVIWCRKAIETVGLSMQQSSEATIILPFLNNIAGGPLYPGGSAQFDQAKASGTPTFNFTISQAHMPTTGAKYRIRGMGVSYGVRNDQIAPTPFLNDAAEFSCYAKKLSGLGANSTIPFGSVRVFRAFSAVDWTTGSAVHNVDPIGDWILAFNSNVASFIDNQVVTASTFGNMLLHFRCVVIP